MEAPQHGGGWLACLQQIVRREDEQSQPLAPAALRALLHLVEAELAAQLAPDLVLPAVLNLEHAALEGVPAGRCELSIS